MRRTVDRMFVDIAEAAERLNVSTDTIRRRIRAETLRAHKQSGKWLVDLEDMPETEPRRNGTVPDNDQETLVDALRATIRGLEERLAVKDAETERRDAIEMQRALVAAPPAPWWKFWR